jgi:hypothetical protein
MGSIKGLDSTGIYAYTTLISVLICVPAALIMEGPYLKAAADKALAAHPNFYVQLALVGLLYHLYNQVTPFPNLAQGPAFFRLLCPTIAHLIRRALIKLALCARQCLRIAASTESSQMLDTGSNYHGRLTAPEGGPACVYGVQEMHVNMIWPSLGVRIVNENMLGAA